MEQDITLKNFLKEILEPIIEDCVTRSMEKYINAVNNAKPSDSKVMDISETAQYLKVSKATVYGYVHNQLIPNYKHGNRLYFRKEDIDQWISKSRRKSYDEINEEATAYLSKRGYK